MDDNRLTKIPKNRKPNTSRLSGQPPKYWCDINITGEQTYWIKYGPTRK
jgi:hypothetical protein